MIVRWPSDRAVWYGLLSVLGAIGCTARVLFQIFHPASWGLETALWGAGALGFSFATIHACQRIRRNRPTRGLKPVVDAALEEWERLGSEIAALPETSGREALREQLDELKTGARQEAFRVVLLGTVGAGKTALARALGAEHASHAGSAGIERYEEGWRGEPVRWPGLKQPILIRDTPGISRADDSGSQQEGLAQRLAEQADLILWVCEADLTGTEMRLLDQWVRSEKRVLLLVNKQDLRSDAEAEQLLRLVRDRVKSFLSEEDVIGIAAAPRPVETLVEQPDGRFEQVWERPAPQLHELRLRLQRLLEAEGEQLRELNIRGQARRLEQSLREERASGRKRLAYEKIDQFAMSTAASVFANPIPGLELAASAVLSYPMLRELGMIYGATIPDHAIQSLTSEVGAQMARLGMLEAATSLIAGLLKKTIVTYAAAGVVQALAMAYLVQVAGRSFVDYLERGQSWGPGGVEAVVLRQFESLSRVAFLKRFLGQAVAQVFGSMMRVRDSEGTLP